MNILEEASKVVDGPRQADYGTPTENHMRTARLWSAYLRGKYGLYDKITPEDVCFLNILQKVSRGINGLTRDTLVDIAGYARNIEIIQETPFGCSRERDHWQGFKSPVHEEGPRDGKAVLGVWPEKTNSPVQGGGR